MNAAWEVCVDASLVVKVLIPETDSDKANAVFDVWASEGKRLIAPSFFSVEIDSILRQKVRLRKELTVEQAEVAFAKVKTLPIREISVPEQRQRAWEIARDFDLATVYDATYLALAELGSCEFWTADEQLFNRVKDKLPFVRWLGDYVQYSTP